MGSVSPELLAKFSGYIRSFNEGDDEIYRQCIPNSEAEHFLSRQIPLLECPDKDIEKMYYFRWWTFRKHIKETEKGHIITEFLPDVRWAGPYNSIVCASCFHIREGRWLRDPEDWLKQYIDFWLDGHGNALAYSSWLAHAVWEYCSIKDDFSYAVKRIPKLTALYEEREAAQKRSCGLYWSLDVRDGMEYSISGSGLRPTLNSYAYADAVAIAEIAGLDGQTDLQNRYLQKALDLKKQMDALLWDHGFYRGLPLEKEQDPVFSCRPSLDERHHVKELMGLIPWYFNLPDADKSSAFLELLQTDGFKAPFGLTTAEQRHPRFMEAHAHACLWNGPVWPFATSQTLVAVSNLLRNYTQNILNKDDFYEMLLQYVRSQSLAKDDGTVVPWIDENLHPYTGRWIARDILEGQNWEPGNGGCERGKDYNHSLFCDLVLSGLLGIHVQNGSFAADPIIPDSWEYFRVENLRLSGRDYQIIFDKNGTRYQQGTGLIIRRTDGQ